MLTPLKRCISGAAMYFKSQVGNSGEMMLRYSRTLGERDFRQRFLQVMILMVFSLLRERKEVGLGMGRATGASTAFAEGRGVSTSFSSRSSASDSSISSAFGLTGIVAFFLVGRS